MSNPTSASVDWEQLDMIADGYEPDFVEIYREFETDIPRILSEVEGGLAAGDANKTARAAHQAKGSAANFGFVAFSAVMAQIESQAKGGSIEGLDERLRTAQGLFRESLATVRAERGI